MSLMFLSDLVTIGVLFALLVATMLTLRATQRSRGVTVLRFKQRHYPFERRGSSRP